MAYGIDTAAALREQRNAIMRGGVELHDDIDDVDAEDDVEDDEQDFIEGDDQQAERPPPEALVDYELLISVAHGLGRWMQDTNTGQKVYVKDQDCVGKRSSYTCPTI